MKTETISAIAPAAEGLPSVRRMRVQFENPVLRTYEWDMCEIRGAQPGPRLCVSAGVHVNEVSSIEAAVRLQAAFAAEQLTGTVSILPLVNVPARFAYSEYVCPLDGKNINFTFPGRPDGSFSEVLCDTLMREWVRDATCAIDLHGGDLRENVSKFIMYQRGTEPGLEARAHDLARCFDAEIVVGLHPRLMEEPGRLPTALAARGQLSVMSEAGANGLMDEESIAFHVDGVMNVARRLGMISSPAPACRRARVECDDYLWVPAPESGEFHAVADPGAAVAAGQQLGEIRNLFGDRLADVVAPAAGFLLWRMTQPTIRRGAPLLAVATPVHGAR